MLHFGIYYLGKKRSACRNDYCTVCQKPTFTEGFRSLAIFHFFFIPVIPLGLTTRWFCKTCGKDPEANRPSKFVWLVAGITGGVLFTFIAVMLWLEERNQDALWIGLFGLLFAGGSIYLIRRPGNRSYTEAKLRILPLPPEVCPYCQSALLQSAKPFCHSCNVRIMALP